MRVGTAWIGAGAKSVQRSATTRPRLTLGVPRSSRDLTAPGVAALPEHAAVLTAPRDSRIYIRVVAVQEDHRGSTRRWANRRALVACDLSDRPLVVGVEALRPSGGGDAGTLVVRRAAAETS